MELPRFSMGIGDRFGLQGQAQLKAFFRAKELGVDITPVWNKSHREHTIIGTHPDHVKLEADEATKSMDWQDAYFVDADHISIHNVDLFMASSSFFTIDIAESIGQSSAGDSIAYFKNQLEPYLDSISQRSSKTSLILDTKTINRFSEKYLAAIQEAQIVYQQIKTKKGDASSIIEVSLDETAEPQSPEEIFLILAALALHKIPAQTIAPRFTGAFNKGVDYRGDCDRFAEEFEANLKMIQLAVNLFDLPKNLKLSIHSGSDKFSIYGIMRDLVNKYNAGLHVKTAGTTWLEELIGLAISGNEGLSIAKNVYRASLERYDELSSPYLSVLDINPANLPVADQVQNWDGDYFADCLRHDQTCPSYNPDIRQLLHIGYKVAAEMGDSFYSALKKNAGIIGEQVETNIFERHMKRIFIQEET
mgnify:CR=1 FL=1